MCSLKTVEPNNFWQLPGEISGKTALWRVLASQVAENLEDAIEVCHPRSVAIQKIGEDVLAISKVVLGVFNLIGHFLEKLGLNS